MPRWEHGSEDRLKKAAIELFEEQGFENTSVVEIAKRASVTTRTFFRYFPDKREVVFAESERLRRELIDALVNLPEVSKPLRAVIEVLTAFHWRSLGSRVLQRRRQAVIAASPELLERDLMKHHAIALGLSHALQQRGVNAELAWLSVRSGIEAFFLAYEQWLAADEGEDPTMLGEKAISMLNSILPVTSRLDSYERVS